MESNKKDKREDWFGDNHLEGELPNLDEIEGSNISIKEHFDKFDLIEPFKDFIKRGKK